MQYTFKLVRAGTLIPNLYICIITYLPQVYCHNDNIVCTLFEELGLVLSRLLVILLNFGKHQSEIEVVKAQNGHQTVEQNALNLG